MEVVKTQTSVKLKMERYGSFFGKFLQNHPKIPEFPGGNLNVTEIPSRYKSPPTPMEGNLFSYYVLRTYFSRECQVTKFSNVYNMAVVP